MSIYVKGSKDPISYPPHELVASGKTRCFLCGEKIKKAGVHWMGSSGDIYFHPHCALSFCRRIMEDVEFYYNPDPTAKRKLPKS